MACFFQLAGLWFFLRFIKTREKKYAIWAGVAHIFLLASTPKAIFHLAVNLFFFFLYWRTHRTKQVKKFILWALRIPEIFFLILIVFKRDQFLTAFNFFTSSYSEGLEHPAFFSQQGFFYVIRFLNENPIFLGFFLLSFFAWPRVSKSFRLPLLGSALFSIFLILIHNEKLPFFILSLLPLIAIYVIHFVFSFEWSESRRFRIFLLGAFLLNAAFFTSRFAHQNQNQIQREALTVMENYLHSYLDQGRALSYFDANDVLPRDTQIHGFVSTSGAGNLPTILNILRSKPELVFFSNRMSFYARDILSFFEQNEYVHVGGGAYGLAKTHVGVHSIFVNEACYASALDAPVYFYEGTSFMTAKPVPAESEIYGITEKGKKEKISSGMTLGALTRLYNKIEVKIS